MLCLQLIEQKLSVLQRLVKGQSVAKIASGIGVGLSTIKDRRKSRKDLEASLITVETEHAIKTKKAFKNEK